MKGDVVAFVTDFTAPPAPEAEPIDNLLAGGKRIANQP